MPSLLEQLQGMYGQQPTDPLQAASQPLSMDQMLATQPYQPPPPPGQLDAATADAVGAAVPQAPNAAPAGGAPAAGGSLGHPDVLSKLKEILAKNGQDGSAPDKAQSAPVLPGLTPQKQSVKQEEGGPNAAERATDVAVRGQAELDSGGVQQSRLHQQADQLELQAKQLRIQAQVEDEQRKKAEAENAQKQERLRTQQMQLSEQKDEPINPKRYFQNMSLFSKAAAVISAFSYGYLNPKGGGAAPIIGTLTDMAKQDVQAQLADQRAGEERRGSLISMYERQYGDTTLVAKRLEADKMLTLAKQARAEATDASSAQAKAQAEDLGKQLDIRADVLHQDIQKATLSKPIEVTTEFARPAKVPGEGPGANADKFAKADAALEERGYAANSPERTQLRQQFKMGSATQLTGREAAQDEKLAKASQLSPEELKDARTRLDGLADSTLSIDKIEQTAKLPRGKDKQLTHEGADLGNITGTGEALRVGADALPFHLGSGAVALMDSGSSERANTVRRERDTMGASLAKMEFGRVTELETAQEQARMPMTNAKDFVAGLNYIEARQVQHYKDLTASLGQGYVDNALRARGIDPERFKRGE